MGKVGRNEQCPCGSGKKFKHCCLVKIDAGVKPRMPSAEETLKLSLITEIKAMQQVAVDGRKKVKEFGVFILFTTAPGDAWLLEITESDAVQLAAAGKPFDIPIDENPETIEINWSHIFAIQQKKFVITAYSDRSEQVLDGYPTHEIKAAIKRIRKRYSKELLEQVHVPEAAVDKD